VRDHPNSLYWRVFLHCSYPINYLDFLLPDGVRWEINHIQTYYRQRDEHALERLTRQRIYLTISEMDSFVNTATSFLRETITELQGNRITFDRLYSALEIIRFDHDSSQAI
jgi:hypothetical protein